MGTGYRWAAESHDCWTHDLDLVLCSILWDGSLTSGSFWRVVSVMTLPRESNYPGIPCLILGDFIEIIVTPIPQPPHLPLCLRFLIYQR